MRRHTLAALLLCALAAAPACCVAAPAAASAAGKPLLPALCAAHASPEVRPSRAQRSAKKRTTLHADAPPRATTGLRRCSRLRLAR
jgi:hypothetical protein